MRKFLAWVWVLAGLSATGTAGMALLGEGTWLEPAGSFAVAALACWAVRGALPWRVS